MGGYSISTEPEKAILIGITNENQPNSQVEDYLVELAFLVDTAGAIPVKKFIQRLDTPNARTYIGSGKLEEIHQFVTREAIDIVIFDDELSPSQLRNIEKELGIQGS